MACIVTEMENDGTRVSISTKQLEMYKGEMIEDRDAVMKNAEQRVRAPPPLPLLLALQSLLSLAASGVCVCLFGRVTLRPRR